MVVSAFPPLASNVTVYIISFSLYVAVYVAAPFTISIAGVQPEKVYSLLPSFSFMGVSPSYEGVEP